MATIWMRQLQSKQASGHIFASGWMLKRKKEGSIDGKQLVEDAGKAGINYLGKKGDTMIGSWGATGQKFNGLIDEVQIWDRALSAKDIKASMEELAAASVEPINKLAINGEKLKH